MAFSPDGTFADPARGVEAPDVCGYPNEWPENLNPYFRAVVGTQPSIDWSDSIQATGIPRLVIHGREDPVPLSGGRAWVYGDSLARLVVLSPAGHYVWLEQREAVLSAIDAFLDGGAPALQPDARPRGAR